MKLSTATPSARPKAVWGPRRILTAVALTVCFSGTAATGPAEGKPRRKAQRVRPGAANGFVNSAKMDADVSRRATGLTRFATADVIVPLENGADLPAAF